MRFDTKTFVNKIKRIELYGATSPSKENCTTHPETKAINIIIIIIHSDNEDRDKLELCWATCQATCQLTILFTCTSSAPQTAIQIKDLDLLAFVEKLSGKHVWFFHNWNLLNFVDFTWVRQTVLHIFEPLHIFNCKFEPLPQTAQNGSRSFETCHLFNCKVEPLSWTDRHGSRVFEPCHIFNCKVEPLYVILNRAKNTQEKNNKTTMMKNVIDVAK